MSDDIDETPERDRALQRWLLVFCTFLFVYLVVEGFLFMPWLLIRYGGQ